MAVTGRAAHRPRDQQGRFTGFDGGARQSAPRRAETHEETLLKIIRSRAADVGRNF